MVRALISLLQIISRRPATPQNAFLGIFVKTLPVKFRAQVTPVNIATATAALGYRGDARIVLERGGGFKAFALRPQRSQ